MIVETMSKEEIVKKFRKDWNGQLHYVIQAELGSSKYRRFILKNLSSEKEYYFKPIYFESSSGINYVILPNTKGKRDFKKYGLLYTVFLFFERKDGIHTMMAIRRNSWDVFNRYVFYTPHFFDRYRERFLKDIHIDKMDAILSFYKHNATSMIERLDNPQYVNNIFFCNKARCSAWMSVF